MNAIHPLAAVIALALSLLLAPAGVVHAQSPPPGGEARPAAEDPVLERRLQNLARELRCLVCQNESLAASNAPLAEDMRREIREQMRAGRSDREVVDFLVQRYGNFVRYRPPFDATTLLLWLGPALMLAAGATVLIVSLRRRPRTAAGPLTEHEQARLRSALEAGSLERRA